MSEQQLGHPLGRQRLMDDNYDPALLRPWVRDKTISTTTGTYTVSESVVNDSRGHIMPSAQPAVLTQAQWMEVDQVVLREFADSSPIAQRLIRAGLVHEFKDGLRLLHFQSPRVFDDPPDCSQARCGRDALSDQPMTEPSESVATPPARQRSGYFSLPLPITYSDFTPRTKFNFAAVLRQAAHAARLVGERVDQDIIEAIGRYGPKMKDSYSICQTSQLLADAGFYGPFERVGDFFVQMTVDTVRLIVGLPLVTVQWQGAFEFDGEVRMQQCFKVMGIYVAQCRSDSKGNFAACRLAKLTQGAASSLSGMDA